MSLLTFLAILIVTVGLIALALILGSVLTSTVDDLSEAMVSLTSEHLRVRHRRAEREDDTGRPAADVAAELAVCEQAHAAVAEANANLRRENAIANATNERLNTEVANGVAAQKRLIEERDGLRQKVEEFRQSFIEANERMKKLIDERDNLRTRLEAVIAKGSATHTVVP